MRSKHATGWAGKDEEVVMNKKSFFDRIVVFFKRRQQRLLEQCLMPAMLFCKIFSLEKDVLDIEISNCNLRCAMCPRNEVHGLKNERKGMMDLELFKRIIDKVVREKVRIKHLWFGNWGEPLLNRSFPDMVRYAKAKLPFTEVLTFTNLTCLPDAEAIIQSGLDVMEISFSGMTQEVYARNHIGGDVHVVLEHLKKLIQLRNELKSDLQLIMKFHDYIYNKKDVELGKKFCEEHGIEFKLHRCYIPCVEANIQYHRDKQEAAKFYSRYIDLKKEESLMCALWDPKDCYMREHWVSLDFDGRIYRCNCVYEEKYLLGPFFDHSIKEIAGLKSEICMACAKTPISWWVKEFFDNARKR